MSSKRKQLYCPHWMQAARKTSVYCYKIFGADINLCKKCEAKLRKEIKIQSELEKELGGGSWGNKMVYTEAKKR